jgi:hypothetical protein
MCTTIGVTVTCCPAAALLLLLLLHSLMSQLGYRRYIAQGGDWGAIISRALGV